MTAMQFIGEKITAETEGEVKQPTAFTWRGTRYRIAEIQVQWFDWGFSAGAPQKSWRTRRHRNCFRVKTDSGEIFELYLDRARADVPGQWFLYQRLDND